MNCGRNAAKKIVVFGFRIATSTPSRNTRHDEAGRAGVFESGASTRAGARNMRMPSQTRYAAPAYLTTSNASADTANSAASPSDAPSEFSRLPHATPATEL